MSTQLVYHIESGTVHFHCEDAYRRRTPIRKRPPLSREWHRRCLGIYCAVLACEALTLSARLPLTRHAMEMMSWADAMSLTHCRLSKVWHRSLASCRSLQKLIEIWSTLEMKSILSFTHCDWSTLVFSGQHRSSIDPKLDTSCIWTWFLTSSTSSNLRRCCTLLEASTWQFFFIRIEWVVTLHREKNEQPFTWSLWNSLSLDRQSWHDDTRRLFSFAHDRPSCRQCRRRSPQPSPDVYLMRNWIKLKYFDWSNWSKFIRILNWRVDSPSSICVMSMGRK